jgi:hypothetical protein
MRSIGHALMTLMLAVLGSCLDKGEQVRLVSGPMQVGPTPVVLGTAPGLPVHGKQVELRIYLTPDGYHRDRKSQHGTDTAVYSGIYGTGDTEIKFAATLIGADGTRRVFDYMRDESFGPPNRSGFFLSTRVADAPRTRPIRLEVTATVPVSVDSVLYWTGDPDSRCFPCL